MTVPMHKMWNLSENTIVMGDLNLILKVSDRTLINDTTKRRDSVLLKALMNARELIDTAELDVNGRWRWTHVRNTRLAIIDRVMVPRVWLTNNNWLMPPHWTRVLHEGEGVIGADFSDHRASTMTITHQYAKRAKARVTITDKDVDEMILCTKSDVLTRIEREAKIALNEIESGTVEHAELGDKYDMLLEKILGMLLKERKTMRRRKKAKHNKLVSEVSKCHAKWEEAMVQNEDIEATIQHEKLDEARTKLQVLNAERAEYLATYLRQHQHGSLMKPTKSLSKMINATKTMTSLTALKKDDGTLTDNVTDTLKVATEAFENIYSATEIEDEAEDELINLVKEWKHTERVHVPSVQELQHAASVLAKNKSCGPSGLPPTVFIQCPTLIEILHIVMLKAPKSNLPRALTDSVIVLLYKKNDPHETNNWRPISMESTSAKILEKAQARMIGEWMRDQMHPAQIGFVTGRNISDVAMCLQMVEEDYVQQRKKPEESRDYLCEGVLIFDYKKAFDKMSRRFILKVLGALGVGEEFIEVIERCSFTNTHAKICIDGQNGDRFETHTGVRQGSPVSPMLFGLATLPFILAAEAAEDWKGLKLGQIRDNPAPVAYPAGVRKETFFADDSKCYLRDHTDVMPCKRVCDLYCSGTGMEINMSKSAGLLLSEGVKATLQYNNACLK